MSFARRALLTLLFTLLPVRVSAQVTEQAVQGWALFTSTGTIADRFQYFGEVQPRFALGPPAVDRVLFRPALGYRLTDEVSLWLGYAWTPQVTPTFIDEHRAFQQLLVENGLGGLRLINRSRFEQRFIAGRDGVSLRLRHLLRGVVPFGDTGFGLAVFDELFVNLSPAPGTPVALDQNRLFAGVVRRIIPGLSVELGYMFHYLWRAPTAGDRVQHNLLVWLSANTG